MAATDDDRSLKRKQRSFYLTEQLIERLRNAVNWTRVIPGEATTLAELAERALEDYVTALEQKFNNGEPFEDIGRLPRGPGDGVMERVWAMRRQVAHPEPEG